MIPVSTFSINTARWDLHSGCPTEAPPRQHFCTQSAPPAFVCLAPQPSSLIQPARDACFCFADSEPSTTIQQTSKKTKAIRPLIILASPPSASATLIKNSEIQKRLPRMRIIVNSLLSRILFEDLCIEANDRICLCTVYNLTYVQTDFPFSHINLYSH